MAPLADAGPTDLAFVRSKKWARGIRSSRAGALIVPLALELSGRTLIRSLSPDLDFGRSVAWLHPAPAPIPGTHPGAQIAPGARVDPSASIVCRSVAALTRLPLWAMATAPESVVAQKGWALRSALSPAVE